MGRGLERRSLRTAAAGLGDVILSRQEPRPAPPRPPRSSRVLSEPSGLQSSASALRAVFVRRFVLAALASSSPPSPPAPRARALPAMVTRPEPEVEAMDAELTVAPPGCSHLGSFKVDNWKQNLRAIYQCFVWSGTAEARKRKVRPRPAPLSRLGHGEWGGGCRREAWQCGEGVRGSLAVQGGSREKPRHAGRGRGRGEAKPCGAGRR